MNLFKEPSNSYTDFYDIARFRLAWNMNVLFTLSLFLVSVFFFFTNKITFLQYFSGFVITLTGVIYLYVTRTYKTVSYFITAASLGLVFFSLITVNNIPHMIEPLWMVIITIFTYFNLGKIWGHVVLTIVALFLSYYFLYHLNYNEPIKYIFSKSELIGLILEICICLFVIGYIIYNFIQTTSYAEQKLRDVNEVLNAQYKLIHSQNEEKTVLLQEIHHRVKNNLQVITSLLRLQSSEIESEKTKSQFTDAINRVMTMSLIHQKMYQEKNLSQIDASDYFKTLIQDLIHSSSIKIPIDITINSELKRVGTKTIVPLALLVAELVSNSLKHAFETEGKITVFIGPEMNGKFNLEFIDNGNWKTRQNESSFGLQLIETLNDQLEGTYTRRSSDSGTRYNFKLSNLDVSSV